MIYFIILAAIATRFIPHMPNLAPVTALAIFAAVYLPKKQAIAVPLVVRFVSDIFLGFFSWPLMVAVYASHLAGVGIGLWVRKAKAGTLNRWLKIGSAGIFSAGIFFLVTNFVMFYPHNYPQDWSGLMLSYTNALPFLRGTLMGDVGYTVALFASYEFAKYLSKNFSITWLKAKFGLLVKAVIRA